MKIKSRIFDKNAFFVQKRGFFILIFLLKTSILLFTDYLFTGKLLLLIQALPCYQCSLFCMSVHQDF